MLRPFDERQRELIGENILDATRNITKLNQLGYDFLKESADFSDHGDLAGFVSYYSNTSLTRDLLSNAGANKYSNVEPGDENYSYFQSRAYVYSSIIKAL